MPRLIDFLMMNGSAQFDGLIELPLIVADNVAHYWYEDSMDDSASWDLRKDFPNLAPPFQDFFIEFRAPKVGLNEDLMFGCRFTSKEEDDYWDTKIQLYSKLGNAEPMKAKAEWFLRIGHDGQLKDTVGGQVNQMTGKKRSVINVLCTKDYYETSQDLKVLGILPCLFAISLLHCKNVELKTVIPPAPLSKKYQKKTGRPLVKYNVLEIDPMKKVLRTEGQSETLGLKHALHICRGHFKDYSKGGGLFGKYKGLYWWESHVRGDPSQGVVVKDYNVNAPKKK